MSVDARVNILLVDDRPDGLVTMEAVLSHLDYTLVKAGSGAEALRELEKDDYAVILLDVQMPDMDGFQTATNIKKIPRASGTPIIFVTAINKDPFYIYQGYCAGAVDYIFKPFDPYILQSKVGIFADLYRQRKKIQEQADEIKRKESELYQARKLEVVGRLAGGVAHDFNNIITGILGLSHDIWKDLDAENPHREDLEEIIKAGNRAFALTKQLLGFARKQIVSPQIIDLHEVVRDLHRMLRRLINENIEIRLELNASTSALQIDPGQIEQVLVNLAINARDAMPDGGGLTLSTQNVQIKQEQPESGLKVGSYIELTLTDTGCGMEPETLAHLFEPFYSTKDMTKGTGLGLATVYGIVKQNQGHIAVESAPTQGSRFRILLPSAAAPVQKLVHAEPAREPVLDGKETILVVEDEEIVRRVVVRNLRSKGYHVLEAQNGQEALELALSIGGKLDLLVSDVVMPGMNGRELAMAMRLQRPTLKILFMSGYSENGVSRRRRIDAGTHFIEKTFTAQVFARKVREVLDAPAPTSPPEEESRSSIAFPDINTSPAA